jgi:NAD(P)-dependent dehydrogenase (short-subunit alcohol dehydrogenase family)
MGTFDGMVALVTGGGSGLGAADARRFALEGAKVVIADRREEPGRQVENAIKEAGGEAMFLAADVSKRSDVEEMIDRTVQRFGRLDCAVNNAGIVGPVMTPLADIEEERWDELINTNLRGVWLCMKYEIRAMLPTGKGAIVNMSSIYGLVPSDVGHTPYTVSKHGVIGLTKSAAVDYGAKGIRVNAVAPGYSHSEMVDPYVEQAPDLVAAVLARHSAMNRLGEPDEIAAVVTWLCSDAASFVNGSVLVANGGGTTPLY